MSARHRDYDADRNSAESYTLAIRAAREKCVRSGSVQPRIGDVTEARWAKEGEVSPDKLDVVRNG